MSEQNPAAPAQPLAARDVLMKYPQQWEHLATEGHVLLARVAAYQHKTKFALLLLGAAAALGGASFVVPAFFASMASAPARWVANAIESAPQPPAMSPAPSLAKITPRLPDELSMEAFASIPSVDVIAGAMAAAAKQVKAGGAVSGCNATAKITAEWATVENFAPSCRATADKSRTWVWGAMARGNSYGPFMTLIRKDEAGAVTVTNLAGVGTRVPGLQDTDPNLIPRAIAADFPELIQGGKQ